MSEKCHNNNSDNILTSRPTDGGKNVIFGAPEREIHQFLNNQLNIFHTWATGIV